MTLVVQTNLVSNLFDAEKARLQQALRAFHPQQSQVADRRHADIRFEDVTKTPDREVNGLREVGKRQFTTNVFAHHLNDFFYSFIQGSTQGRYLSLVHIE